MEEMFNQLKDRLKGIDFGAEAQNLFSRLAAIAKKLGRVLAKQVLCLYYVLREGDLTQGEKLWVYAALLYVLVPGDIIPRRIFGLLGIGDDLAAIGFVIIKVRDKITPQILQKVEMQLDKWFGCKVDDIATA